MRIKVCGMTLPEQVSALDEMGVDLAGFILSQVAPLHWQQDFAERRSRSGDIDITKWRICQYAL